MYEVYNQLTDMVLCTCPDDYKADVICKCLSEKFGTDVFTVREAQEKC